MAGKRFSLPPFRARPEWLFCAGIAAGAALGRQSVPSLSAALFPAGFAVAVATALFFGAGRRSALIFFAAAVCGFVAVPLSRHRGADHYAHRLDGRNRAGGMVLKILDTGLPELPEIPPPSLILAEARFLRLTGEGEARPVSGRIFLRLPRDTAFRPRYGDLLRVDGVFRLPDRETVYLTPDGAERPAPPGGRNFAGYLAARKVAAVAAAERVEWLGRHGGATGFILDCRDGILARALHGIRDPRSRQAAAGIFFGCRSGLESESRRDMVRSGTIHIFAVSGLHVGILAGLFLLLLRVVPFRARHLLAPLLVLLYVVTTGANVPALRAFWMIAVWCVLCFFLLRIPPLPLLLYLAGIMVLLNPDNLGDPGFLYSFVITGALLLFARSWKDAAFLWRDPAAMMPESPLRRRELRRAGRRRRVFAALGSCLVAFLGGAAISLYFQGLFLPGAVFANLVVMPLVGLLFPVVILKLLLGFLPFFDQLAALVLNGLFALLELVVAAAAVLFPSTAGRPPGGWSIAGYFLALLLLVAPGCRLRWRFAAGFALLLFIAAWHLPSGGRGHAVLSVGGRGAAVPAFGLVDGAAGVGVAVNAPDAEAAIELARFFKARGVRRIDRLHFTAARAGNVNGLPTLLQEMPVGVIVLPPPDAGRRHFLRRLSEAEAAFPGLCFADAGGGPVGILEEKGFFLVEYSNPGTNVNCRIRLSGAQLEIESARQRYRHVSAAGNYTEVVEYEF